MKDHLLESSSGLFAGLHSENSRETPLSASCSSKTNARLLEVSSRLFLDSTLNILAKHIFQARGQSAIVSPNSEKHRHRPKTSSTVLTEANLIQMRRT
ncbi:hypothetical protein K443DRAFT_192573 [Laccaria amethystina LaAM-08-1]|uniref:Uncharacterized protein n=1 Tax=Laccaria amethystina LaAM-08-1 TaxID=1095629 RepID=A0A0C9WNB1_9AGAR|nr:hypothetical protein K443DRAFT_192573 [Laccaria amethystina LaAM-08-1]